MMFGFEAAAYLKADQFNYGVRKGDYDPYFRRIIDKNKVGCTQHLHHCYLPSRHSLTLCNGPLQTMLNGST